MQAPLQLQKDRSERFLVLLLVAVMGGFVLTSAVAQRTSTEVSSFSDAIASTSSPSVERLAHLRSLVFEVELNLSEYARTRANGDRERRVFELSLDALERVTKSYLTLPLLSGEQPYWGATQAALIRFESSVRSSAELVRAGDVPTAQRVFSTSVRDAGEQLVASSIKGIEFHALNSRVMAMRIKEARERALFLTNVLSGVCVALGVAGLILVLRQGRRRRALVDAHWRFHEARAAELEQFAGRVAHDIRNPLSTANMGSKKDNEILTLDQLQTELADDTKIKLAGIDVDGTRSFLWPYCVC